MSPVEFNLNPVEVINLKSVGLSPADKSRIVGRSWWESIRGKFRTAGFIRANQSATVGGS